MAYSSRFKSTVLAAASLYAVGAASMAHAETTAQDPASPAQQEAAASETADYAGVGEIIVTARKRSESINDVAMSITAVTGDDLLARGVNSPADLVKVLPSLQVSQTQKGNVVYTLRGVGFYDGTQGSRPTVGLYLDEVELPFSAMGRGATLDLERVEVLKGPQGTLFGQNATGGVVNYIAAKPTDVLRYGGSASYGRFSEGNIQGFISGPLSDTLSFRVAAKHEFGSGWQKSITRDDTLGAIDVTTARVQLDWHPSDGIKFLLNVNGFNDRSESQAATLLEIRSRIPGGLPAQFNGYPIPPRNPRAADWDIGENLQNNIKFRQVSLRGDFELGSIGTLTSLTSYAHMDILTRADMDGVNFQNLRQVDNSKLETAAQELRLAGDLTDGLSYVVGASYAWYSARQLSQQLYGVAGITNIFIPFGITDPSADATVDVDSEYKTTSVFGSIEYKITDQLKLNAGIRYSSTKANNVACMRGGSGDEVGFSTLYSFIRSQSGAGPVSIAPGGCISVDDTLTPQLGRFTLKEDSVPFRVGLDWNVTPDTLLYANVSRGFKGGSYPVLGSTRTVSYDAATQEELLAYEAGFKSSLLSRTLQVNAAAFYYDYKDKQLLGSFLDPVFGAAPTLVNVPKSRVFGAELQVDWEPTPGLTISGSGTYLKTKILGCSPVDAPTGQSGCQADGYYNFDGFGTLINLTGQKFAFAPKFSGNLDVEYKWALSSTLNAFLGGAVQAQTGVIQRLGEIPALGAADPNLSTRQKGYALLDLRVGISDADDRWSAAIWGRNVANTYYKTGTFYSNDSTVAFLGKPATYGLTVTFRN